MPRRSIVPIWFGIFVVLLVEMAQIAPPVGFNLFLLQGMTRCEITYIARVAMPFFWLMVLLVYLLPGIITWLRHLASLAAPKWQPQCPTNCCRAFGKTRPAPCMKPTRSRNGHQFNLLLDAQSNCSTRKDSNLKAECHLRDAKV